MRSMAGEPRRLAPNWSALNRSALNRSALIRPALVAFLLAWATNLVSLAVGADLVSEWSQNLMLPCLLHSFALGSRSPVESQTRRLRRGTLAGLFFSWLGDLLPGFVPHDTSFLAMVGAFLLGHLAFCWGFWPLRQRRHRGLAPYAVAYVALMAAIWQGAGDLRGPIVVYGIVLTLMAVLATGVHRLAAWGGVLFMASDSLIALQSFRNWHAPWLPVTIMATYGAACLLITAGVSRCLRRA